MSLPYIFRRWPVHCIGLKRMEVKSPKEVSGFKYLLKVLKWTAKVGTSEHHKPTTCCSKAEHQRMSGYSGAAHHQATRISGSESLKELALGENDKVKA